MPLDFEKSFKSWEHEPLSRVHVSGTFEAEIDVKNYEQYRKYIQSLLEIDGVKIVSITTEV